MTGMRKRRPRIAGKATLCLLAIHLAAVLVTGCIGGEKEAAVEARTRFVRHWQNSSRR
jgi:hypothetical protein